jgi:hypothetical protein
MDAFDVAPNAPLIANNSLSTARCRAANLSFLGFVAWSASHVFTSAKVFRYWVSNGSLPHPAGGVPAARAVALPGGATAPPLLLPVAAPRVPAWVCGGPVLFRGCLPRRGGAAVFALGSRDGGGAVVAAPPAPCVGGGVVVPTAPCGGGSFGVPPAPSGDGVSMTLYLWALVPLYLYPYLHALGVAPRP